MKNWREKKQVMIVLTNFTQSLQTFQALNSFKYKEIENHATQRRIL